MVFLVSYKSHRKTDVIQEVKKYGKIVYESPIIHVIGVETAVENKTILKKIVGVTRVDSGYSGKLAF